MMYHKTKDLLYVKALLGHNDLRSTLRYTQLMAWDKEEYVCKAAQASKEAAALIEQGFDYVTTTPEGLMLFRKPK